MTNYSDWDSKASRLLREDEEEAKKAKEENDKALGLEGGPKGPPQVKADEERAELNSHSQQRKEFIKWKAGREVTMTHGPQAEPIELAGPEVSGKAVTLKDSSDVTYVVPESAEVLKLYLINCKRTRVRISATMITSWIEACRCEDVDVELAVPIATIQVDECTSPFRVTFAERDHVGKIYHQNSPGLSVAFGGDDFQVVGQPGAVQYCSSMEGAEVVSGPVRRGENDFPIDVPGSQSRMNPSEVQTELEAPPAVEERRRMADVKRNKGNEMFRANDFMQAAMEYTAALELDDTVGAIWANRSQCWLKLGNNEKAFADAQKCTEVDPSNAKGWFRKGMSLHFMERYPEAIPSLLQAEKLDPKSKQIVEAIKFAQLKARS